LAATETDGNEAAAAPPAMAAAPVVRNLRRDVVDSVITMLLLLLGYKSWLAIIVFLLLQILDSDPPDPISNRPLLLLISATDFCTRDWIRD
jgi:hypothetical protein